MLVSTVIQVAMRKVGALGIGVTTSTERLAEGLLALQVMLRSWASLRIAVFSTTKESIVLVPGDYIYTWGSGGTIDTTRPYKITGAYIADSSNASHSLSIITEGTYKSISTKLNTGRPTHLCYRPLYPLAELYTYPIPDTVEALHIYTVKPYTETGSFDVVTSTISFPPNYEEAIIYNLAIRLASTFGKIIPPEVLLIANTAYDKLITLNAANQIEPVRLLFPAGLRSYSTTSVGTASNALTDESGSYILVDF